MKFTRLIKLVLLTIFLAACAGTPISLPGPKPTKTSSLPTAQATVIHTPSAEPVMRTFLDALVLSEPDYASMYARLTKTSQAAISPADFAAHYDAALNTMSANKMEYNILSSLTNPQSAQVAFHFVYHTVLFGDLARDMTANFVLENGDWKIQWEDGLILPELAGCHPHPAGARRYLRPQRQRHRHADGRGSAGAGLGGGVR
jgi:hypothetical protein